MRARYAALSAICITAAGHWYFGDPLHDLPVKMIAVTSLSVLTHLAVTGRIKPYSEEAHDRPA